MHPGRDKRIVKSLVVGRPILLALEDIDGGPSFLEKALRFLEKFGKFCCQLRFNTSEISHNLGIPFIYQKRKKGDIFQFLGKLKLDP